LILEPVPLYRAAGGEVEDNGEALPIGVEEVVREGGDVTALTYGPMRFFGFLEAPIDRVCAPDLPYSYRVGDEYFKPNHARIRAGLRRIMEFSF
jgi:pyruvate/2-oxoglutarate/acetoin dehydrogenase E1 component